MAGAIALGASTAVAADPLGSPSPTPVAMWGQGTSTGMMDGANMGTMHRTSTGMMDGANMGTMHRTSTGMMDGASMGTMHR